MSLDKVNKEDNIFTLKLNNLSLKDKEFIIEHLVLMYDGKRSHYNPSSVIIKIEESLRTKQKTNLYYGLIAEFILLILLIKEGYEQEYCYSNLEENAPKKGFDGLFTKENDIWILESKSSYKESSHKNSHKNNIKNAYEDILARFQGNVRNDPWENALRHARNFGSKESLIKKLTEMSSEFTKGLIRNIQNENIIIGSTIFDSNNDLINISFNEIKDYIKDHEAKKQITIVMNVSNSDIILEFLEEEKTVASSKSALKRIRNKEEISSLIVKLLYTKEYLSPKESEYLYTVAHLLIDEHNKKNDKSMFFIEYAYYIIAKTSIKTKDYRALYDFSVNYGFYPISRRILDLRLIENINLRHVLSNLELERFFDGTKVLTYEQKEVFEDVLKDERQKISFLAPTSYGKSEIIFDHLKQHHNKNFIGIIVPSKALINQVHIDAKERIHDRKIIIHDQNFIPEEDFKVLAVVTQERALRLIDDGIIFDVLYIDEAHEIISFDFGEKLNNRSLLLTRLIRLSRRRNPNLLELYLSPVLTKSSSLKIKGADDDVVSHKIRKNLKLLDIKYVDRNDNLFVYDRYLDLFIKLGEEHDNFEYIKGNSLYKNLHFLHRPILIEKYTKELYENMPIINPREISLNILNLSAELREIVHPSFNLADYILRGIIYMHASIPQSIKNYILSHFRESKFINHLIANSVILAGMNLPIDNLFYICGFSNRNDLKNLMGRVNRLNEIFSKDNENLEKIFIPVHFLDFDKYSNKGEKGLKTTIENLRKSYKDEIKNPLLQNVKVTKNNEKHAKEIVEIENELLTSYQDLKFKDILVKAGAQRLMNYSNIGMIKLQQRINEIDSTMINNENMIETIVNLFIAGYRNTCEYSPNENIQRLKNIEARNYYNMFITDLNRLSFKERVNKTVKSWQTKYEKNNQAKIFVGSKFGEINLSDNYFAKSYIQLSKYINDKKSLYNYAIVKLQIDEDFVSFDLSLFLNTMLELKIITQKQFDEFMFRTSVEEELKLLRTGLSRTLLRQMKKDKMINQIKFDDFGNIRANNEIKAYIDKQKGITKFQLEEFFL